MKSRFVLVLVGILFANIFFAQNKDEEKNSKSDVKNNFSEAMKLDGDKNFARARDLFLKVAESKDNIDYAKACFKLAEYYYHSRKGVEQDKIAARKYYKLALEKLLPDAEKGDPEAQYIVAICIGIAKFDRAGTVKWLEKAVAQDYTPAQAELAYCYMKKYGVKFDPEKVKELAEKASAKGNMSARAILGAYYLNVGNDNETGIKLIKESADAGCAGGQYMLSRCYNSGKGVQKNKEKATELLILAADQGLDDAVYGIRMLKKRGHK